MSLFGAAAAMAAAEFPSAEFADATDHRPDPFRLENLVVSAAPYARERFEVAQPTSVFADRDLMLADASALGELLAHEPGVSSSYFGPGASRPIIRGMSGDRVRLLANGVGLLDASVVSPDHAVALDPLLIERIEVVRGPATLLHGSSAVGGVVNVIDHRIHTARPEAPFNARVEARALSVNDEQSGGAVLEGGRGAWAWHLDGYRRRAGNVEIPGFAETARRRLAEAEEAAEHGEPPPVEVAGFLPNSAVASDGGAFGLSLLGEHARAGFAYSGHNARYGVPVGAHARPAHDDAAETPDAEDAASDVTIDLRQRRLDVQAETSSPFGVFSGARLKFGSARYRHTEFEGAEIGTVFRNVGFDARAELLHESLGPLSGAWGWHGGRSTFDAIGDEAFLPSSRTQTHALFVFEEATLKPFAWQFGARMERQDIELRDGSRRERQDNAVSASTGLVWTLDDTWSTSVSLAHSSRAPNAQELFASGPHTGTGAYELGDPQLAREHSRTIEIAVHRRAGVITGALTAFAYDIDGYIYEQPTGQSAVEHDGAVEFVDDDDEAAREGLPIYRFTQHDARFHGAEVEAIVHVHEATEAQLELVLGADLVRARNRTTRTPLPRITPSRLRAGVMWTQGRLTLGSDVQWVGRQRRVAPDETPTAGYSLVSAYATYRVSRGRAVMDVFVRGSNLTDQEARTHTSFLKEIAPLPGRNLLVGLRTTF